MAFLERYLIQWTNGFSGTGAVKPRPYGMASFIVGARLDRVREHMRLTFAFLICLAALFASEARAQPAPKPPVVFRLLALGETVSDVFYDLKAGPVSVLAGNSGFSSPYVAPEGGRVVFYRVLPPEKPELKPRQVPVAEIQIGEGGPYLVLMIVDPEAGTISTKVVDDSWAVHPVKTVRIFNFSRRLAMVKLGESVVELPTTQSHIFPYPDGNQVWLQAATKENETWVLRVGGPQVTLPKARSTVVLIDQPPSIERKNPFAVLVRNFIEFEPTPPVAQ